MQTFSVFIIFLGTSCQTIDYILVTGVEEALSLVWVLFYLLQITTNFRENGKIAFNILSVFHLHQVQTSSSNKKMKL